MLFVLFCLALCVQKHKDYCTYIRTTLIKTFDLDNYVPLEVEVNLVKLMEKQCSSYKIWKEVYSEQKYHIFKYFINASNSARLLLQTLLKKEKTLFLMQNNYKTTIDNVMDWKNTYLMRCNETCFKFQETLVLDQNTVKIMNNPCFAQKWYPKNTIAFLKNDAVLLTSNFSNRLQNLSFALNKSIVEDPRLWLLDTNRKRIRLVKKNQKKPQNTLNAITTFLNIANKTRFYYYYCNMEKNCLNLKFRYIKKWKYSQRMPKTVFLKFIPKMKQRIHGVNLGKFQIANFCQQVIHNYRLNSTEQQDFLELIELIYELNLKKSKKVTFNQNCIFKPNRKLNIMETLKSFWT